MMFGVLRGGPAWRARLPVPPLPLLKAVEEPLRMQDRPGLAALLFDNKADLGERLRTIDIGAQLQSELWRTVANAGERSTRELQNQWSASLAMSTDGSFPSRPRQFLNSSPTQELQNPGR